MAEKPLRVALGQIRPALGDVSANLRQHLDAIAFASVDGADVIVFPELSLTGYQLKDLAFQVARPLSDGDVQTLVRASRSMDVLFSFVEEDSHHLLHVAAVYASKGQVAHVHRKVYLPTYGLFEEGRHYARGQEVSAFTAEQFRGGIMICEDAWHPSVPYLLSVAGSDVIFVPSASPGRPLAQGPDSGSKQFWMRLIRTYAQLFTSYVVFVNRVGFEDGLYFFGESMAAGPDGDIVGGSGNDREGVAMVDLDLSVLRQARFQAPLLRDEDPYFTARELRRLLGGH